MEEFLAGFWTFAGNFWWLIFPIGAALGGVGKAIERASKRRHERKLETIRIKGQIKAAEAAARTQPVTYVPQKARDATPTNAAQLLEKLHADHDEITARWLDYELDVAKIIAFPAMSDGRQPLTAAFLRAKKSADTLRPATAKGLSEDTLAEYLDAVGNYAVAFEIAEKDARRIRDASFTEPERKRLARAQQLLRVAVDESATQAERNVAYKRVREELDGLISLSDEAVVVLEQKVGRELPPAS
jgi:hypothetical protein